VPLGLDFLTFLAATVLVIPTFKSAKISPVLGFLFSGLLLGQLGCAPMAPMAPAHAAKQHTYPAGGASSVYDQCVPVHFALCVTAACRRACSSSPRARADFCLLHSVCRLFRNTSELEKLSELGVLFLLFEMGLELSFDRLKARPQPRPMCLPLELDLGLADLSLARSVADRAWGPL